MIKIQKGVGLVEVLVALVLLSVAVLGFIALQYRAIEATSESSYRVEAITLARDLAERIRINRTVTSEYSTRLSNPTSQKSMDKNCYTAECTAKELAGFDVYQIANKADSMGMTVNYIDCYANKDGRKCVYVAWGDTSATQKSDESKGDCTDKGSYTPDSTCLIMEVY